MYMFIVQISLWIQQTVQFTPLVSEHTLLRSHSLWEKFSICTLCCSCSHSWQFSFLIPPGTHHHWVGRDNTEWEVCLTLLHMSSSRNRTLDLWSLESHALATWSIDTIYKVFKNPYPLEESFKIDPPFLIVCFSSKFLSLVNTEDNYSSNVAASIMYLYVSPMVDTFISLFLWLQFSVNLVLWHPC